MTAVLGRLAPGLIAKLNLGADLVLLVVALFVSSVGHYSEIAHMNLAMASWLTLTAALSWFVGSLALRYYDPWASRDAYDDAALAAMLVFGLSLLLEVIVLVTPAGAIPTLRVGQFLAIFGPIMIAFRLLGWRRLYSFENPIDEVLIVGTGALGRLTGEDLSTKRARRTVVGYVSLQGELSVSGLCAPMLGDADDLENLLTKHPISEVYIAGRATTQGEAMQRAIKVCERLGVPFALPAHNFRFDRAKPLDRKAVDDGYLHYLSVEAKPIQMAFKRLMDITASSVALWVLSPLLLSVAAIIKLTSKGPVFFKQVRVGLHGKPFTMYKFRSMVINAEELKEKLALLNEQNGPVFKIKQDPRITGIGRFIRKYSIDELPQLLNVARGDMSIVGPRPPVPSEVAKYEGWQRRRLSVRPGLTCIWQVSGRNEISFEEWMYLDMRYVDNWNLKEDINLILRTVPVVLTGRGAS